MKPGFFKNETLGTADPLYALIFEGLWCLADRDGRLEDRPLRIHAEINPYRPSASTMQALDWLVQHQFAIRYEAGEQKYIVLPTFRAHQQPHVREPASKLPAPTNQEDVSARDKHSAGISPAALTPSSLTPPSGLLTADSREKKAATPPRIRVPRGISDEEFLDWKLIYPQRSGDYRWQQARSAINARLAEGHAWVEIVEGTKRYAEWCRVTGKIGTETVKQAASFVGKDKPFLEPWIPPPTKAETRLNANISAAQEFMRRTEGQ